MSPTADGAGGDAEPTDDGDEDVLDVAHEGIAGWIRLDMNWAPKLAS